MYNKTIHVYPDDMKLGQLAMLYASIHGIPYTWADSNTVKDHMIALAGVEATEAAIVAAKEFLASMNF